MKSMKVTVGPIIGKVTATSARILLEIDDSAEIELTLTADGEQHRQTSQFSAGLPHAVQFNGLQPATRYRVDVTNLTTVASQFKTASDDTQPMRFGVVSCNNLRVMQAMEAPDLWETIAATHTTGSVEPFDVLLHIGDQVYGDHIFERFKQQVEDGGQRGFATALAIQEAYRDLYRTQWQHPSVRHVLANVPNLMMWDDHDIRDDWGSREADWDPDSVDYFIGQQARRVFHEYQRQLWTDISVETDPAAEHHLHRWGNVGLLMLDIRGGRSFHRSFNLPFLGRQQWRDLQAAFSPKGYFSDIETLLVASSVPIVFLNPWITTIIGSTPNLSGGVNDLRDHWSYGVHRREQNLFLELLAQWKAEPNTKRDIQLIGGDDHMGSQTDIWHKGVPFCKQLISSPVTNEPPTGGFVFTVQALQRIEPMLGDFRFRHAPMINQRNFGIVEVDVSAENNRFNARHHYPS